MFSPCYTDPDVTFATNAAKSCLTQDTLSPRSPFGPKSRACLVKPKNFEKVSFELDELENYFIWSDLGRGTFATVKFATRRDSGLKVALKVYERSKLVDPIRKKSVENEIKILQRLNHPAVLQLYEYVEEFRNVYLVLEYVQGTSLHSYVLSKSWNYLDEARCAGIFVQIIEAIHYCHCRHVAHRDVKLENVIIDSKGKIKLIDFGFATVSEYRYKKSFMYCGTPNYMAPEIVRREKYAGEPADVWAAGVLLFMMITGKFPFASAKESMVFKRILKHDVIYPDVISFKCQQLLKAMLEPSPSKRIQARDILKHPWVVQKGLSTSKNAPHLGDDGNVECQ